MTSLSRLTRVSRCTTSGEYLHQRTHKDCMDNLRVYESNRLYDAQLNLDSSNVIKNLSRSYQLYHSLSGAWSSRFLKKQRQGREPKSYLDLEAAIRACSAKDEPVSYNEMIHDWSLELQSSPPPPHGSVVTSSSHTFKPNILHD
jgi:hypothetical protein